MLLASLLVGHDALGGGDDGNAETLEHAGELVSARINAEAGLAHAAQALDGLLFAGEILEGDADDALGTVVDHLEVLDVALVEKDLGDGLLHLGRRNVDGLMLGASGVADAGQHIGNGVGDLHVVFLLYLELPVDAGVATEVLCQYLIGHSLSASEEARSTPLSRFP